MNNDTTDTLEKIRAEFLEQVTGRMEELRQLFRQLGTDSWDAEAYETLYRMVHSLVGSAGTFGLLRVSEASRILERSLSAIEDPLQIGAETYTELRRALTHLDEVLQSELSSTAPILIPPRIQHPAGQSSLIYLVEDDPVQARDLIKVLEQSEYRVRHFSDLHAFTQASDEDEQPAAVIMDMVFPEGKVAGAEAIEVVRRKWLHCPPVLFLSVRDDIEARLAAYRAGTSRYLVKPVAKEKLIRSLDQLTYRMPTQPYRVLLVDDDLLLLRSQAEVLRQAGMEVRSEHEPLKVLDAIYEFMPEVLVLDVYMPEVSGPELAALLREDDLFASLPILFLSAETDLNMQLMALDLGGDHFLVKPIEPTHLVMAVSARARRYRETSTVEAELKQTLYEKEREHLALNYHAIVSIADAAGKITYVNDRFCEISGYRPEELLGKNHSVIKSGRHLTEFYQQLWQTIAAGNVWHGEVCNRRKDGEEYWVDSTIVPFLDKDGKPYQYVSIRTDITQIKRNEQALHAIVEGTSVTGDKFFHGAAEGLANSMGVRFGFIASRDADNDSLVNTIAIWDADHIAENFSYDIKNTPCEKVLQEGLSIYPERVADRFPEDRWLQQNGIESYIAVPLYDSEGRVLGHMGVMDDRPLFNAEEKTHLLRIFSARVSGEMERRRSEVALQESEDRLRSSQNFANIGTWDWDIQTGNLFWSERIAPLFGYEVGELETTYENFINAVHPDDRELVTSSVGACVESGIEYDIEHRVVWPDGQVRWLSERGDVVRAEDGTPLHMLGVVQDIDDRKRAEEALAESERQLREAQTLSRIGNWEADLVSGELNWSDEIYRIFGYEPGSFRPSVEAFHAVVHPDDLARVHESERRAQQTGYHDVVHRIIHPDGTVHHVHELAQAEMDTDGNLLRLRGTVQDITARVQIEQALIAARNEAERASQAKSDFLSSMSHELRTPMNAILGFAQILEFDAGLDDDQSDSVHEILKAGHHLLELINEVLDLAKVESGRINLSIEPVELSDLVDECFSLLQPVADGDGIKISHVELGEYAVRADRTRLKQVLINLLSNAIKYNRVNGEVRLEVCPGSTGSLRINVVDSGRGVSANNIEGLFQPFNRLDAEGGGIEGSGIGLTITRRLVEMMEGSIGVESTEDVGSCFWIELPLASSMEGKVMGDRQSGVCVDIALLESKMHTVLYIEDNPVNLKLVSQILGRRKDIHLIAVHEPGLGLDLIVSHQPDLILLDINMPEMDGYEVLRAIRADNRIKDIKVLAITANAMPGDIERGMAAGFNDYLTKPFNVQYFLDVVDGCLGAGEQAWKKV